MKVLDSGMRDKLPKELYNALKPYFVDAWKPLLKGKGVKSRHQDAMEFSKKSNNYDFGKIYKDNRTDLQKAIEEELAGRPSDAADAMGKAAAAANKVNKYFSEEQLFNRYKMVVSGAVMKARNFSQVLSYEELKYTEVEIIAILDQKTSSICKFMNGRRIQITTAANYVKDYMKTDPANVTARFGWPKRDTVGQMMGKSTADAVSGMGAKLPPYHAHCRTTVVPGYTERVVNQNGKALTNFQEPSLKDVSPEDKDKAEKSWQARIKEYSNLTHDEVAAKINSSRHSRFETKTLDKKYRKHVTRQNEFPGISKEAYNDLAIKILDKFDFVYIYKYFSEDRVMFFDEAIHAGVVINTEKNVIETMFHFRDDTKQKYDKEYLKLL
jgi:hypothetical protein